MPFPFLASVFIAAASAVPLTDQRPFGDQFPDWNPGLHDVKAHSSVSPQGLSGKFLHITDLHPDQHFVAGSSVEDACHHGKGSAGHFGSAGSDCDSPITLIDDTLRWIEDNLKDEIDFVVWTGDSARHDNDEQIPRTEEEIMHLNKLLADGLVSVFQHDGELRVPIVPTIGNNDVMPHNIFKAGPNRWTKRFREIWDPFIPEEQRHTFVEGGWFTVEVIPNKLSVISLNTMYFFDSNTAVDGCEEESQPGFQHMEWLRVQLKLLRQRHMKAILIGHIPPARSSSKRNWDETCWQKYALWLHQYRDVITGSMYGHMNIDHFLLQDSHKIKIADLEDEETPALPESSLEELSAASRSSYLATLRSQWSKLPSPPSGWPDDAQELIGVDQKENDEDHDSFYASKKGRKKMKKFLKKIGGPWAERYSVSLVSPSIVPNYYPSLRIIEYNISGLEDATIWTGTEVTSHDTGAHPLSYSGSLDTHIADTPKEQKKKKKKKPDFKVPDGPSSSAPPGPAYSNQPLTLLGYTQYFANLTNFDEAAVFPNHSTALLPETRSYTEDAGTAVAHRGDRMHLTYEVEYDTRHDRVYQMKDLTVRSFFQLACRIAKDEWHVKSELTASPNKLAPGDQNEAVIITLDDPDSKDDYEKKGDLAKRTMKPPKNDAWITFLERAFVGLIDGDELDNMIVE